MTVGFTMLRLGGATYYSGTFPRGGLAALFSWNLIALSGSNVVVTIEHKDIVDLSFSAAGTVTLTGLGIDSVDVTSIKEQVRISYVVGGSNNYNAAHVEMLAPAWRPYN